MTFFFLTPEFYADYALCPEIERKASRPYIMVGVRIRGAMFAAPLRSNINHKYVLWTDESNRCGVDFSKAVVIRKQSYIDAARRPYIRPLEFDALRGKDKTIARKMEQYIAVYKKARKRLDIPRNKRICEYSTLQYFEQYL